MRGTQAESQKIIHVILLHHGDGKDSVWNVQRKEAHNEKQTIPFIYTRQFGATIHAMQSGERRKSTPKGRAGPIHALHLSRIAGELELSISWRCPKRMNTVEEVSQQWLIVQLSWLPGRDQPQNM